MGRAPSLITDTNTLRPRQHDRQFSDIFKCISWIEIYAIRLKFHRSLFLRVKYNNIPALVQILGWHQPGDKPLCEPMMVRLSTHICVTRPVNRNTGMDRWIHLSIWYIIHHGPTIKSTLAKLSLKVSHRKFAIKKTAWRVSYVSCPWTFSHINIILRLTQSKWNFNSLAPGRQFSNYISKCRADRYPFTGISGFVTCCPYCVWCCGSTTFLLWVGPILANLF